MGLITPKQPIAQSFSAFPVDYLPSSVIFSDGKEEETAKGREGGQGAGEAEEQPAEMPRQETGTRRRVQQGESLWMKEKKFVEDRQCQGGDKRED